MLLGAFALEELSTRSDVKEVNHLCTADDIQQGRHACHEQIPDTLAAATAPNPADTMMVDEQRYRPYGGGGGFRRPYGGGGGYRRPYGGGGGYGRPYGGRPYGGRWRRDVMMMPFDDMLDTDQMYDDFEQTEEQRNPYSPYAARPFAYGEGYYPL